MKKVLKDNLFLLEVAFVAAMIIIIEHFYPGIMKYMLMYALVGVLIYIIGFLIHRLIIKKIIRNIKIKQVTANEMKVLNNFLKYKFDEKILLNNGLTDYINFIKCLIEDFKEMEKDIKYTEVEMNEDLKNMNSIKNKTAKEYINKSKEVLKIIFKYYDEDGIRKI